MSRWDLYIHVVWATRHREPLLTQVGEAAVFRVIHAEARNAGVEILELNGMPDHLHLLLKPGPCIDLPRLMKQIKGTSSAAANDLADHQHRFRWQEGYFAATVTPAHVPKLRAYIQNQKHHHRNNDLLAYWEETGETPGC